RRSARPPTCPGAAIRRGARALGEAHLQPSPQLVLGCRIASRELCDDDAALPTARGGAAQGKAGNERPLPEAGADASAVGRSGGHAGDAAPPDPLRETRPPPPP